MKKILVIILLFLPLILKAQSIYYVQDVAYNANASDANAGTDIDLPWATWQKAFDTADAGDTVYFRGGTWTPTSKADGWAITSINPTGGHGNNGTHDAPICFFNYPGEVPILDCSAASLSTEGNTGLGVTGAEYIHFKGLTIRNVRQLEGNDGDNATGFYATDCTGVIWYTNMTTHNNEGVGTWFRTYDTIYVTNCDSYANNDSLDNASPSGGADGFALSSRGEAVDTFKLTVVTGCRSWNNADDGFDIGSTKQLDFHENWSWNNGYEGAGSAPSGTAGDGVGLKVSYSHVAIITKRIIYNNIFAWNTSMDQEAGGAIAEVNLYDTTIFGPVAYIYNNTMYNNFTGFGSGLSWGYLPESNWNFYPTAYYNDDFTNNLVYVWDYDYPAYWRAVNYSQGSPSYVTLTTNTFRLISEYGNGSANPAYTVTDADFLALPSSSENCTTILGASRQADGSLPDIGNYFKLDAGSDLKAAGTDVGMTATPDIGVDWTYLELDDPEAEYPTVLTLDITDYNAVQAVVGANVISDGGGTLTAKGVCYSTSENPTTADSKVTFTAATGSSSIKLTTLKSNTTYHFRAYATNSVGTSYGSDVSITTPVNSKARLTGSTLRHNGQTVIVR
jgi:hypothetical protein